MKLALASSVLVGATSVMADDFSVDWWIVDGGGDMWTGGGDFEETDSSGHARIAHGNYGLMAHGNTAGRRPELGEYGAPERFKRMRDAVGEGEPLDMSISGALRDAIVALDPDIHSIEDPHAPRTEHILDADGDAERGTVEQ